MSKASKQYIDLAKQHGFVLARVGKHAVFKHGGGGIIVCPLSPSDSKRGLKNLKRDIRKVLCGNNSVLRLKENNTSGVEGS